MILPETSSEVDCVMDYFWISRLYNTIRSTQSAVIIQICHIYSIWGRTSKQNYQKVIAGLKV